MAAGLSSAGSFAGVATVYAVSTPITLGILRRGIQKRVVEDGAQRLPELGL